MRLTGTFKSFGKSIGGACLAVSMSMTAALAAPEIGQLAPDFQGIDSKGNTVTLSELRGKTVILEWTNHDCPYVRKHYRTNNMQALQKETTETGMVWLSVISSAPGTQGHVSPAKADELTVSRDAAPSSVILDPEGTIGRLYDARTTPHMYIVKPDGKLAYMGGIDDHPTSRDAGLDSALNYVRNALDQMAAGDEVDPAVTRAYGCSVKYAF